ncbi:MAG: hypothetical protein ACFCD0_10825 [Gemmataceae bacterium]
MNQVLRPNASFRRVDIVIALASIVLSFWATVGVAGDCQCEQGQNKTTPQSNKHAVIEIEGTPHITKFDMKLERPRRVVMDTKGNFYIVDSGIGTVYKRTPKGKVTTIAKDLDDPSGITLDKSGNVYVSTHGQGKDGEGKILKITPGGMTSILIEGQKGLKGMVVDKKGDLYVCSFEGNQILKVDGKGNVSKFVDLPTPAALILDKNGNFYSACSALGLVAKVTPKGKRILVAKGLKIPSDLHFDPDGRLVVCEYGAGQLVTIGKAGKTSLFLKVPEGTIGFWLDPDGNVTTASWDKATVTNRKTVYSVLCPYSKKLLKIRIKEKPKKRVVEIRHDMPHE